MIKPDDQIDGGSTATAAGPSITPSPSDIATAPSHQDHAVDTSPSRAQLHESELISKEIRHTLRTPINHILGYCELLLEERTLRDGFRQDLERVQTAGRQLLNLITEHFDPALMRKQPRDLYRLHHDLRTPVNHIVGYCELLQEEALEISKPQYIPELQKIRDAASTWLALMEENLNLRAPAVTDSLKSAPVQPEEGVPHEEMRGVEIGDDLQAADSWSPTNPSQAGLNHPAWSEQTAAVVQEDKGALLIVDDDPDARNLLVRRFQFRGYHVASSGSGSEALELLKEQQFDLILLDLIMPGLGGIEVLKQVRSHWSMAEMPVIVLTGMDSSADVVEALRLGANDYLTKPAAFAVVQARAETHLKLKRAQLQLKAHMEEVRRLADALEQRNQFIQKVFGRYVTDEIVQTLLETPEGLKLGGESREVTILMSDLRGFTALTERLAPERVIEMLNVYLCEMTEIISSYDGVIDEFIGDAILTIFGAPIRKEDHPERAVACALAMQLAMGRVNEQLGRLDIKPLAMGIGINTGRVVVGNIGCTKRAKFGVVGTPVNVTARIQAASLGGQVLIAEASATRVGRILCSRDKITLMAKGIAEPLTLYDVEGLAGRHNLRLPPRDNKPTGQ